MSEITPHVAKLLLYPIKALDGVAVEQVTILTSGALKHDREFALYDASGNYVNGKRHSQVHLLRSQFDLTTGTLSLSLQGREGSTQFQLQQERHALEAWLGEYFGFPVQIQQNLEMGFPDDTASPGPTIVSTATLEAIASWYPDLTVEEVRRRFRANIEIGGVPAFWEDQLFTTAEQTIAFQIGAVKFTGVNPCQRCVVVTRNPDTGAAYSNFQKIFVARRRETLPDWVERSRFNHFFRVAVNTRLAPAEVGKVITIGDPLQIL